jgi:DDE family transposase
MDDNTTQCWLFPELLSKRLVVSFNDQLGSSDGGAVLLKAADERLGLTRALTGCLRDERDPLRVTHGLDELVMQRVFAIACGYPDANDAARLADDPVHKLLLGRDPVEGQALASQPTLSRFENSVRRAELFRLGDALARSVIERHRRRLRGRVRRITIDLDQTADLAHGEQQLALFNGYYGNSCYLPLLGFVSFDNEAEQYLVAAVLRPGNAPDKRGGVALLKRLLPLLCAAFPKARVRVRLDAGFASPEVFDFLEGLEYVVAMPKNTVLERRAEPHLRKARRVAAASGQTRHIYAETRYATRSWPHKRRVIIKAEVTCHPGREPKDNPRFVVTNLPYSPAFVYERIYCRRGDVENRIKELKLGLEIDRTSCTRFLANQFRVFLTSAAFVLMQELRLRLARTTLARAQAWTLRDRLLKIGARVVASVRRLVIHLPASYPFLTPWARLASSLGARAG